MGSGEGMRCIQLCLMAFLAFFSQISATAGSPQYVMSAPNLLRVGTEENIFVEIQGNVENSDTIVNIFVKNYPTKTRTLASTTVRLTKGKHFQEFGKIKIPAEQISTDSRENWVVLQAEFVNKNKFFEKLVLVSFQSGFIFIQTDKPIYNPGSTVQFRIFAMKPSMEPMENTGSGAEQSITVDVMTPDDITLESKQVSLISGIHSGAYKLPDIVSFGEWKVVAKFHSSMQNTFTAEFQVKEYVLPSFEVKISPPPETPFFYVDSDSLTFTIEATYVFGEEVDGTAYVVFGLLGETKKNFPNSIQRVPVQGGKGQVTLMKEHITSTFPNIHEQEGKSIYVAVSVLTASGGEMVEAELRGIKIVKSPYTIHFKRTPKYFKPAMSFNVMVEVTNPDDSPAKNIAVMLEPGKVNATTSETGIARFSVNPGANSQSMNIKVMTRDPHIASHRQASATVTANPYTSSSNRYLRISVNTEDVALGQAIKVDFIIHNPENQKKYITYLILSRGQLIQYNSYESSDQTHFSQMVQITKEMLPSFRIVAYYHTSTNDLESDSVWIDVEDTCMGSLKLEIVRPAPSYEPRKMFKLKITGDPESIVGLVAVDKSVYVLNNTNRLTQKKIWDVVEQYDTGCTSGGGKDNMNVFYDAGLLFQTDIRGTPARKDVKCSVSSRRKRASTIMDVRTNLANEYKDQKLQKECCLDGMRDIRLSYTCERRSEYILDGSACIEAFLRCCREMQKHKDEIKEEILQLARSEDDDKYEDTIHITTRSYFPESWLWNDITLGPCPKNEPNCKTTTSNEIPKHLPDSITTWQLMGVSLSRTLGICVADPVEVIVFKPFFIDLRLPYSAVRGEQLEIRAILHNYNYETITVRVQLKEETGVCSAAYKKKWFSQEVQVGSQTTRAVSFIIVPMEHGEIPIEIKAAVRDSHLSDGIKKMLRVVPQGVLVKTVKKIMLDPAKNGGKQVETINSKISTIDLAPETPRNTIISLTGIEQLSVLLDNAISGESMGSLIKEPTGCGEQNIDGMSLPLLATIFLDKTSQWDMVGFDKRKKAIEHIKTGYNNQLAYRKPDGSFSMYSWTQSTTRLTSYVATMFAMAYNYVSMDPNVICGAIKFIILHAQLPDGMFNEVNRYSQWNVVGENKDVSITALCLISLLDSRAICSATVGSLPDAINKAVAYLENHLNTLTNPYAAAVASYALAKENKMNKAVLYKFASQDRTHWFLPQGKTYTLEATAYALLALVKAKAFEEARPVVLWLSQQQRQGGEYGSTQATVLVYQAVSEYCTNAKQPPYVMDVDLSIQGRSLINKQTFNNENRFLTRTSKFDGINKDVKVTATGTGEVMFSMVSFYYALPSKQESDCEMFDLKVELLPESIQEQKKIYKLRIEVLYKSNDREASMPVLDIGLPTGYMFNENDLKSLLSGHDRFIDNFEMNKDLSEQGSLIIYLNKISNVRPEEISFRIEEQMKVGLLQPAAVSVYEYYNKKRCVSFYRPERETGELLRLCQNNECVCAEENCSKQKKEGISNEDRTLKACESTETSKIDFVYKVEVEGYNQNLTTDTYTMRILNVIKGGNTDVSPQKRLRTFLGYQHCRDALNITQSKTYLIMGSSSDIYKSSNALQYVLGQNTWVEYWPNAEECQDDLYRPTCLGMEELVEQFEVFGCQMK